MHRCVGGRQFQVEARLKPGWFQPGARPPPPPNFFSAWHLAWQMLCNSCSYATLIFKLCIARCRKSGSTCSWLWSYATLIFKLCISLWLQIQFGICGHLFQVSTDTELDLQPQSYATLIFQQCIARCKKSGRTCSWLSSYATLIFKMCIAQIQLSSVRYLWTLILSVHRYRTGSGQGAMQLLYLSCA